MARTDAHDDDGSAVVDFVMVGALVEVGVISTLGTRLAEAVGDNYLLAGTSLIFGSAALSGIIDNIPYVATLAPIVRRCPSIM